MWKKLRSKKGMTLTEMLATTMILLLVTVGMTTAVTLASRSFVRSLRESEANELCSTLSVILESEIGNANTVWLADPVSGSDDQKVTEFLGKDYQSATYHSSLMSDAEGRLIFANPLNTEQKRELLSPSSYPHGLEAQVDKFTYNQTSQIYTIGLSIQYEGNEIVRRDFQIIAVNAPTIGS